MTRFAVLLALVLTWFADALAAPPDARPDGTILDRVPCPPKPMGTYEEYLAADRAALARRADEARKAGMPYSAPSDPDARRLTRQEFDRRRAYRGIDCERIRYLSDGLSVVGFIWKPNDRGAGKLPLVIFNRGGNRERSVLTPWVADGFHEFVSQGFVVIASQYRGADGGEGVEEYGGADVNDVLNLEHVARSLGYVDMDNVFVLGNSRGGMMTYLALRRGLKARAAAVMSGVTDLAANARDTPELVGLVYDQLIPEFATRRAEAMRERSAVHWAHEIQAPLLILHGAADERIRAGTALDFASRLQALGKTYELVIYARGDHGLASHRRDADRRILDWFLRHMEKSSH